ncbi:ParB/RepB/Spo0J family partition protein [Merismopedia glauca]|uniref:Chromosome partitioning protein ParB n=1 Tax=Merismopedia glauca CCAP 1448/3 TaxID=1296344 RepID=A0A2T1BX11_9CYAN|nr:ParB/RepB/Spo0J family partition protein [Merismopedia glauca]PSB00549.1 chromosome partitioning protein ParB [Merismopedia glauca CCAP 1448/3]
MPKKDKPFQTLGVNALFGEVDVELDVQQEVCVPLNQISVSSFQPRRYFDPEKMAQLVDSVRIHGILQPLLVRPKKEGYELVAGERRFRAAQVLGLLDVPVIVKDLNDEVARKLALIENLQRDDLNALEETEGILGLLALTLNQDEEAIISLLYRMNNEAKGLANQNVLVSPSTQQVVELFANLGTLSWESFVSTRLPLLKLPPEILEVLRNGKIAYTKAIAIAKVQEEKARQKLLEEAVANHWSLSQIKEQILKITASRSRELPKTSPEEIAQVVRVEQKLKKLKPWKSDPSKWKKIAGWLDKIEALLEEESID